MSITVTTSTLSIFISTLRFAFLFLGLKVEIWKIIQNNYQGVQDLMQQHKQEIVAFDDVNDEIFDMIRPADPSKLTLQDFINR